MKTKTFALFNMLIFFYTMLSAQSVYYTPAINYGGNQALKDLLKSEMVYPEQARILKQEGTVILQFTVTKNGKVKDLNIAESAGKHLDNEAIRLFNHLLWTPAQSKGTTVDDKAEIEIQFKLKKYLKCVKQRGYDQMEYLHAPANNNLAIYEPKDLDTAPRPLYENDELKFGDFMIKNMKYPDEAKKRGVSGTVEMFFVVEPSGNITNLKIEKGVGAGCSEEAMRLVKLLRWSPGLKGEHAVRTAMKLSITFNLDDSDNMKYVPANNSNQI
jgi:TonB family protein